MKKTLRTLFIFLILPLFFTSCGKKTHASLTADMIDQMNQLTEVLNTVTDKASAEAAKPKIDAIHKKMDKIKTAMDALPKPTAEEEKELREKYGQAMRDASAKLAEASLKAAVKPGFNNILGAAAEALKK